MGPRTIRKRRRVPWLNIAAERPYFVNYMINIHTTVLADTSSERYCQFVNPSAEGGGGGGHKGEGVRGLSYPLSLIYFENMYSHVYGVEWSPWSVPFEIDYLREGVRVLKYPLSLIFRIKFYLIFIKTYVENITLL